MTECIIVGMGGFIGAVCRYLVRTAPGERIVCISDQNIWD